MIFTLMFPLPNERTFGSAKIICHIHSQSSKEEFQIKFVLFLQNSYYLCIKALLVHLQRKKKKMLLKRFYKTFFMLKATYKIIVIYIWFCYLSYYFFIYIYKYSNNTYVIRLRAFCVTLRFFRKKEFLSSKLNYKNTNLSKIKL